MHMADLRRIVDVGRGMSCCCTFRATRQNSDSRFGPWVQSQTQPNVIFDGRALRNGVGS